MMEKIIEMTGGEFRNHLLNEFPEAENYKKFSNQFYYRGSSMMQANRNYSLSQGDPNVRPIPFRIPSESWTD